MFASAEMARKKSFRDIPKDPGSPPHQNICAIVVDESAAFLILRPQSLHKHLIKFHFDLI